MIIIKMNPYDAITILSFRREFINDDLEDDYQFQAIKEAVDHLEEALAKSLDDEAWAEIHQMNAINTLTGKVPPIKNKS